MSAVVPPPATAGARRRPARYGALAYAPAWLVSIALGAVLLAAGGIVTTVYTHDLYVVFDGGWRTFLGQRPYVDFRSPVGFVYFLPYVLLRAIEPFSLSTLMQANLVVAAVLLLLATLTLPRRMSPLIFFLASVGIVTVVISPRSANYGPDVYSHLAPYNRWCEGAMMLMTGLALLSPLRTAPLPRTGRAAPTTDVAGAVVLAVLALCLFHIKITYFLCSLGLVVLGLVTRQLSWRTVALSAAVFVGCSLLIELGLHLHRPYFDDLEMARRATLEENSGSIKVVNKRWGLYMALGYSAATLLLLLLQRPARPAASTAPSVPTTPAVPTAPAASVAPAAPFRVWRQVLSVLIGGALVGVAANTQTHQQWEIPMFGTLLLVIGELVRRQTSPAAVSPLRRWGVTLILVAGAGTASIVESAAVVGHTLASRDGSACALPAAAGTTAARLLFHRHDLGLTPAEAGTPCDRILLDPAKLRVPAPRKYFTFDSAKVEVARVNEALTLLRGRQAQGGRVMAMDFANPYPAFTGTRPMSGALLWWDMGRSYSESFHPDPQVILGGADYVLEALYDPRWEGHGHHMWYVYGDEVRRLFQPVAEGAYWRLWQRRRG